MENMSKPKLTLYIDLISPFVYLAFHVIRVSISSRNSIKDFTMLCFFQVAEDRLQFLFSPNGPMNSG